ncbi:hypothetical protein HY251_12875 [bacterium]|nr:hypothetical protein [bacterium]
MILRRSALVVLALALLLALVARADDEKERKIDAAHVKKGQLYKFKLSAGNVSVWEIVDKSDTEVTYKIHMTVAGKELPAGEPYKFPLKRKAKKEETGKAPREKTLNEETLEVSGQKFPCTVLETETGGTTVKTWQSGLFPEGIKTQQGKDVTMELVEIK